MTIQSLLGPNSAEAVAIGATETVRRAAEQMRQHGVTALVVKSDQACKGIISDRDIVYAVSRRGEAAISLAVSDLMSHAVVTVTPGDSLKRAMSLMVRHRVRDLPVMADDKLVGVVSMADVAIGWKILKRNRMSCGTPISRLQSRSRLSPQ
jgi:CBS domain-containing protein